jgi:hypothetical protein
MTKVTARYRVGILAAIARRVDVSAMRDTVLQDAGTVKSKERTRVRVSVFSKATTTVLVTAISLGVAISHNALAIAGECSNEEIREEQGSTRLADCRAYEMGSPVSKESDEPRVVMVAQARSAAPKMTNHSNGPVENAR